MRVSRLLTLVGLLKARGSMTADELAGELGVSRRTVYRDVEVLAKAGVRLESAHGEPSNPTTAASPPSRPPQSRPPPERSAKTAGCQSSTPTAPA
jgi:predicted DNA-binding transcriptional regulator YafY